MTKGKTGGDTANHKGSAQSAVTDGVQTATEPHLLIHSIESVYMHAYTSECIRFVQISVFLMAVAF